MLPVNIQTSEDRQKFFIRLSGLVLIYFIFIWLFPTIRILSVGAQQMVTLKEFVVTVIPDLIAMAIIVPVFIYYVKQRIRLNFFDKAFIIFWVSNVILGFILASDLIISLRGFRITYFPMLFYFLGKLFFYNIQMAHKLANRIIMVFAAAAVAGLIIYFVFPGMQVYMIHLTGNPVSEYFIMRMTSLLWTPVVYAFLMALAAIYCFYKINTSDKKAMYYLLHILFWICLLLAVSRGVIIAYLLTFIFFAFLFRKIKIFLITLLTMVFAASVLYFILFKDTQVLSWALDSTSETMRMDKGVSRVFLWNESIKDFKARPWGYGLGKAGDTGYRFFSDSNVPAAPYTTDGWYLKIACETGIYGLLSYLVLFCIFAFNSLKRIIIENNKYSILGLGFFLMASVSALVNNCFDFHPYITFYWLVIGFCSGFLYPTQNVNSAD